MAQKEDKEDPLTSPPVIPTSLLDNYDLFQMEDLPTLKFDHFTPSVEDEEQLHDPFASPTDYDSNLGYLSNSASLTKKRASQIADLDSATRHSSVVSTSYRPSVSSENSKRNTVTAQPPKRAKIKKVHRSFVLFIGLSVLSVVLIVPFQIFLIVNAVKPTDFNNSTRLNVFTSAGFEVCSALLVFSRIYQLFITVTAYVTKNPVQALYLVIYLWVVFVASINYMMNFPNSVGQFTPQRAKIAIYFSTYWIISISAIFIVIQTFLFVSRIRKELSWGQFSHIKAVTIENRNRVLSIQNYKALIILNGFFIVFDLIASINFQYLIYYQKYDVLTIMSIVLVCLTPAVLTYLYFSVNNFSKTALKIGTVYILFVYVFNVLTSYIYTAFAPLAFNDSELQISFSYSQLIFKNIYELRNWFAFFHYTLVFLFFLLSLNLLRLSGGDPSPVPSLYKYLPESLRKRLPGYKDVSGLLNSQNAQIFEVSFAQRKQEALQIVKKLLFRNNVLALLACVTTIPFTAYIFSLRVRFLSGWFTVTIICLVLVYYHSSAALRFSSSDRRSRYNMMLSMALTFVWLNCTLYQMYFVFNNCKFFNYDGPVFVNGFYQSVTLENLSLNVSLTYNTAVDYIAYQDYQDYLTDVYRPAYEKFMPNRAAPAALSILATLVCFLLLVYQSFSMSKCWYYMDVVMENTGTYFDLETKFSIVFDGLKHVNWFIMLLSAFSIILLNMFPYNYFLNYDLYLERKPVYIPSVLVAVYFIVNLVVLVIPKVSKRKILRTLQVLYVIWLPFVIYLLAGAIIQFNLVSETDDLYCHYFMIIAMLVFVMIVLVVCFVATWVISYKFFESSHRFRKLVPSKLSLGLSSVANVFK